MSGDKGPFHIDLLKAKSILKENLVIHGVHQICFVFNYLELDFKSVYSLKSYFLKPLSVNEYFEIKHEKKGNIIKIWVFNEKKIFTEILIDSESNQSENLYQENSVDKVIDVTNEYLNYVGQRENAINKSFAIYATRIPKIALKILLFSTYIVGMRNPNLNSVLAYLELRINSENGKDIAWITETKRGLKLNCRNSMYSIKVLSKVNEINKISFDSKQSLLRYGDFKNQKALILGANGSLGLSIAHLLIRDGSEVFAGVRTVDEFKKMVSILEISQSKKITNLWHMNIEYGNENSLSCLMKYNFTHIYNCLSPEIFENNSGTYSIKKFLEFKYFYIDIIEKILELNKANQSNELEFILNPSTVLVENRILKQHAEYIDAKLEMEKVFQDFNLKFKSPFIFMPRLEAFKSNQTTRFNYSNLKSPIEIALRILPKKIQ